jgi:hypothetical protein
MAWIEEHKQIWRWSLLILLILAIIGPWGFDQVNVPAEYDGGPTHIRLEGDFCGSPISGIQGLSWMFVWFFNASFRLFTGEIKLNQVLQSFGFMVAVILLLLPIFNLLFILIRGARPRFHQYHLAVCAVTFCLVLTLGIVNYLSFFYVLWGIWLYILSLATILILEGIHFQMMRLKDPG